MFLLYNEFIYHTVNPRISLLKAYSFSIFLDGGLFEEGLEISLTPTQIRSYSKPHFSILQKEGSMCNKHQSVAGSSSSVIEFI